MDISKLTLRMKARRIIEVHVGCLARPNSRQIKRRYQGSKK